MYSLMVIFLQFLSGSVMYSYLIARICGINLNLIGDGNPGLTNLWRAKGFRLGILGLLLDYFKGIFPLILFIAGKDFHNNFLISIAAFGGILGHAFSPMLKFKGGKAVTTSFGAWTLLTKWEAPTILGVTFILFTCLKSKKLDSSSDSLTVFWGFIVLFPYILFKSYLGYIHLLFFYICNMLVISYKYRAEWVKYIVKSTK